MSWLRIDDNFTENAKVETLNDRAFRLHVSALCFCARNLTDGHLTPKTVRVLAAGINANVNRCVEDLVAAGLWLPTPGGHVINDYLEFNPSGDKVRADRKELSEKRRQAGLKGAQSRWQTNGNGDGKTDGKQDAISHDVSMAPSRTGLKQSQKPFAHAKETNSPKGRYELTHHDTPKTIDFQARAILAQTRRAEGAA